MCGGFAGLAPLLNVSPSVAPSMISFNEVNFLTIAGIVAVIGWTRRVWSIHQLTWRPFLTSGQVMLSYFLASIPTVMLSERVLAIWTMESNQNSWVQFESQVFAPNFYSNMIMLLGIVLIVSSLASEYRLPLRKNTTDDFIWPELPNEPWITFISKYWLQIACGCVTGLWVGQATSAFTPLLVMGFLVALATFFIGLGKPIADIRHKKRMTYAWKTATGLFVGFAIGAISSFRFSAFVLETSVFALFTYLTTLAAYRLLAHLRRETHTTS